MNSRVCLFSVNGASRAPAGGRVLLVSDDPDVRGEVTRALEREGHRVLAVAHSGHALLHCRLQRFEVLLASLDAPDMSGPSLAAFVRRHCPTISAIYLGNTGGLRGAGAPVVPPVAHEELVRRVAAAWRRPAQSAALAI